jgi:GntR family transcriptional regulator/MocR family aminotransferase
MELAISLDNRASTPLHKQLYEKIRQAILDGYLSTGQKLPSSRMLSESLAISRTTVSLGYEQLTAEGYLETRAGAGTFVSQQIPDNLFNSSKRNIVKTEAKLSIQLSSYGQRVATLQKFHKKTKEGTIRFHYGQPAFFGHSWQLWKRILNKHCQPIESILNYQDDWQGYRPLRSAIADYLQRSRAVKCSADQIIIVSGSQQALDLSAHLLVSPGDRVAIENPAYQGASQIMQTYKAKLLPVPIDNEGLKTKYLQNKKFNDCKLVYVTPSHQFPTGAIMSLPRRLELIAWAQQNKTLIIEDDYDSEFRYAGKPMPALQGLDEGSSVIYIGTFSKVLFPSLRIAYMVLPKPLVSIFANAKWLCDRQCPMLEQFALENFISEGHLERHIRRMRIYYNDLRTELINQLQKHFGGRATILGESSGMHIMMQLKTTLANDELIKRALSQGVSITDARTYYLDDGGAGEFVLGYTDLNIKAIREGISRLALAVKV